MKWHALAPNRSSFASMPGCHSNCLPMGPGDMLSRRYQQQLAANCGCAMVDFWRVSEEFPITFPPVDELPPIYVACVPGQNVALPPINPLHEGRTHGEAPRRCANSISVVDAHLPYPAGATADVIMDLPTVHHNHGCGYNPVANDNAHCPAALVLRDFRLSDSRLCATGRGTGEGAAGHPQAISRRP